MASNCSGGGKALRSKGRLAEDLFEAYPKTDSFPKEKLPTHSEVIGLVRNLAEIDNNGFDAAIGEVSSILHEHWVSRNIYPVTKKVIRNKIKKEVTEFRYITRTDPRKRGETWLSRSHDFIEKRNILFDIFCESELQRHKLEQEYGIPMLPEDYQYLESMRSDRKAKCELCVDAKWHHQVKKQKERHDRYVEIQYGQSSTLSSTELKLSDDSNDETDVKVKCGNDPDFSHHQDELEFEPPLTKKTKFSDTIKDQLHLPHTVTRSQSENEINLQNENDDPLPLQFRHIRLSERIVRNEVYQAMAQLDGYGFSYRECQVAIMVVGNTLFGRQWKLPVENEKSSDKSDTLHECQDDDLEDTYTFDCDTLPTKRRIRQMLKHISAHSLKLVGERVIAAKKEGATITHATDSTTRKVVGTFAPAGIHINRDEYVPLPILNITSETTENTADAIALDFKLLEAASGFKAEELYSAVDVHMTDATSHNKGVAATLANKFNRNKVAGQIFCDSHTTLGFDRGMSKVVHSVENEMGMQNIFNGFLLDVDIDQRKECVSIATVSWALSLFGPDNIQKPWNCYKAFQVFMHRSSTPLHLFLLKDARFGALSKSSAVMCYHWDDFCSFLSSHEYVTNKLACLVRDALSLEYIKVVISVIAAFGLHLVAPFHAMTISCKATHSSLKEFFSLLHDDLKSLQINEEFLKLEHPVFKAVSQSLFDAAKKSYKSEVVHGITEMASLHINECISLANRFMPEMADVLAMQRGKFYDFGEYKKEFPIFEQASNIDMTPVNNLEMERQCGDTDHRLKKKPNLNTVSRGNILKLTKELREKDGSGDFRKMGSAVKILEDITADWNKRQQELMAAGLSKKEANLLHVDNRRLTILERLKAQGGPFTSAEQVDHYLLNTTDDTKVKTRRMREEVTYARDTSVSLPRNSQLFRIFGSENGKRKLLNHNQFGHNLKILLGKTCDRTTVTLADFRSALERIAN